jgi:ubiquinone/menaquinone biosynthesis C-methylase UbiE
MIATASEVTSRDSVSRTHEANLGCVLYRPFALDLVSRIPPLPGKDARVLELSCGSGQLTALLRSHLPPGVRLTACDSREDLLEDARVASGSPANVEWRHEEGGELWCENGCFDVVFSQFGSVFATNRDKALQESFRVLKHGGRIIFNVWDSLDHNDLARMADLVLRAELPATISDIVRADYSGYDHHALRDSLHHAGFRDISIETVHKVCYCDTAREVAVGFIEGTRAAALLVQSGVDSESAIDRLATAITRRYGDNPVRSRMQAIVCTGHKM